MYFYHFSSGLLSDQAECKSTIHWLCDYVTCQANKKATHHSRDLHSMIVAAFSCLQSWIMSHPWLLDSQVCFAVISVWKITMVYVKLGRSWRNMLICLWNMEQSTLLAKKKFGRWRWNFGSLIYGHLQSRCGQISDNVTKFGHFYEA